MNTKYYIYCICHATDQAIGKYIGSTRDIGRRRSAHKYECGNNQNHHLYKTIREHGGWDAWVMKTLEVVYSDNPEDRRIAEQRWIDATEIKLNRNQAYCPYAVYYDQNREDILEYKKEYYTRNKERIQTRKQKYQRKKRLEQLALLQQQGLKPKRTSKNDGGFAPLRVTPPTSSGIENDPLVVQPIDISGVREGASPPAPHNDEKMIVYPITTASVIANDCECVQVQCEE